MVGRGSSRKYGSCSACSDVILLVGSMVRSFWSWRQRNNTHSVTWLWGYSAAFQIKSCFSVFTSLMSVGLVTVSLLAVQQCVLVYVISRNVTVLTLRQKQRDHFHMFLKHFMVRLSDMLPVYQTDHPLTSSGTSLLNVPKCRRKHTVRQPGVFFRLWVCLRIWQLPRVIVFLVFHSYLILVELILLIYWF